MGAAAGAHAGAGLSLGAASTGASSLHIGAYSTVLLCTAFELDLVKLRPGLD